MPDTTSVGRRGIGDDPAGEASAGEPIVCGDDMVRQRLGDRVAAGVVEREPLGVGDDGVDDEVSVADLIEVRDERDVLGGAGRVDCGPKPPSDVVGPSLLVGP